jgi:O-antigen/teichoic acid export membrane protein
VLLSGLISNVLIGGYLMLRLLTVVRPRFHWPDARAFLRFGLPLVAMQIATFAFTFGDRYFLNKAGDTTQVGLYGLAYTFGFLVGTIGYMPLEMVWDPQRFEVAKRADRDVIYSRVLILFNVTLITTAVGLSLFVGDMLRLIATPAFQGAAVFVPVIVGAYVFQAWGTFFNIGIMITERTHLYTVANWAAAAVALVGYVVLIPKYLAWGASLTVVASLGTRFALTYYFSQRLWRIRYHWTPVLRLLALATAFVAVSYLIPALSAAPSVLLHSAMFATYSLLVWQFILADKDRAAMKVMFARARDHFNK